MTLKELREKLVRLTDQARAKRSEIKVDTPIDTATRIESEHSDLLAQIEATKAEIARLEAEEAAAPRPRTEPVDNEAVRAEAAATAQREERDRIAKINEAATKMRIDRAFADDHIARGTSLTDFHKALVDHLAEKQDRDQPNTVPHVAVTRDETVTRRDAVIEYLVSRGEHRLPKDIAADYRGMRLLDVAKHVLEWNGTAIRGLMPDQIAERALHSTSDFPSILEAVVNKFLLSAYQAAPQTFRGWTRAMTLSDFKTANLLRLGEAPALKKVNEHGEFHRGTMAESKETIQLTTYGVVIGITRQVIVNDDLGAFTNIPAQFGQSAATLESDLVWGTLMSNPTLNQDSKAVFHADHDNLISSGGAAPSITTISTGRTRMAKQTGLDGKTLLNIMPMFILVPPELFTTAQQIVNGNIVAAQSSNAVPQDMRLLQVVSEPRLSVGVSNADAGISANGSTTAWYLASSPPTVDTIVYATMEGQMGPFTETRQGFNVDGVEVKCRHDFGVSAADFRGLFKNNGA